MPHIRIMAAAAAAAIAFALALAPASARSCDDGNESCAAEARHKGPMRLDQFMKSWKPVALSSSKRANKSAQRAAPAKQQATQSEPAPEPAAEVAAEIATPKNPLTTTETDGIAVTSFNDINEIDAVADQVQIVAFNDINEIDLAAPPPAPPVPAATVVPPMVSSDPAPADHSWIGKLLLAVAGTIAVAGTARLLIA